MEIEITNLNWDANDTRDLLISANIPYTTKKESVYIKLNNLQDIVKLSEKLSKTLGISTAIGITNINQIPILRIDTY